MRFLTTILILAFFVLIAFGLSLLKKPPEFKEKKILPTLVEVVQSEQQSVTMTVKVHGTVEPRSETVLIPEVSGKIIDVSSSLYAGGFFEKGDVLLTIDDSDYVAAQAQAEASLAQARLALAQEEARAEQARKDWESLGNGITPSPLTLREPQLIQAQASVRAREADLERANRNLERTRIKAPYAGMVKEKRVDIGQYITPGSQCAVIFAIDYAEIRLPVPSKDMAFLNIPENYRGENAMGIGPEVNLTGVYAGQKYTWRGNIVRTEGTVDQRSRMIYCVAQVKNPYGRGEDSDRPPMKVGLFVEAEILGLSYKDVVVLPRHVLRGKNEILIVDEANKIRIKQVELIRADEDYIYVKSGITAGEWVCLTALEFVIDGMTVKPLKPDDEESEDVALLLRGRGGRKS